MPPAPRRTFVPWLTLVALVCASLALPSATAEARQHPPGVAVAGGYADWDSTLLILSTSEAGAYIVLSYGAITAPDEESPATGATLKACTWTVQLVPDTCAQEDVVLL